MNGIDFIADTNALLYIFQKNPCMVPYLNSQIAISVISEMELLSFPKITDEEDLFFRKAIDSCHVFGLSEQIKNLAIFVRRKYGTKLPDSIVAATSIASGVPLVTADKGFRKISELNLRLLEPELPSK